MWSVLIKKFYFKLARNKKKQKQITMYKLPVNVAILIYNFVVVYFFFQLHTTMTCGSKLCLNAFLKKVTSVTRYSLCCCTARCSIRWENMHKEIVSVLNCIHFVSFPTAFRCPVSRLVYVLQTLQGRFWYCCYCSWQKRI